MAPIYSKPLRALPVSLQIGHIDAMTFSLNLRPSLLAFDNQLFRYVSDGKNKLSFLCL